MDALETARMRLRATAAVLLGLLVGCGGSGEHTTGAEPAVAADFEQVNMNWRERRVSRLTEPYGWLSLTGLHMLAPGETTVGSASDNDIVLARGPDRWGTLRLEDGDRVTFRFAHEGEVRLIEADGDQPAAPDEQVVVMTADGDPPTTLESDELRAHLVRPGGRFALRVRDPRAESRIGFAGLDYYPLERSLRVNARFEPHPEGATLQVANVMGQLIDEPNPGRAVFEIDGKTLSLEAVLEDDELFFIFADRTSGRETYGLGRFLYSDLPQHGRVVLDFNQSYNPPCAFNAFTTCPLPPPGNRLDAFIRAGEKQYEGKPGIENPRPVEG